MKKFLIKLFIFLSVILIFVMVSSMSYKPKYDIDNEYMAAIIDKHKRLELVKTNRLILVSGSSMAFGVNSESIEKEFNINVINLALQAGLGFEFILNEVLACVKPGDILLLGLEYPLYDDDNKPNIDLINFTQKLYPPSKDYYQLDLWEKVCLNFQNFRKAFKKSHNITHPVYNRKSFNYCGDAIGHLNIQNKYICGDVKLNKMNITKHANYINQLSEKCEKIGAKLYIIFPCYPTTVYKKHFFVINDLQNQLSLKIKHTKILNTPGCFVYDNEDFYDTEYHLNREGREKMTAKMIDILRSQVYNREK